MVFHVSVEVRVRFQGILYVIYKMCVVIKKCCVMTVLIVKVKLGRC
jgi:hypothetical protein